MIPEFQNGSGVPELSPEWFRNPESFWNVPKYVLFHIFYIRASQFFQIAKQIKGDVVEVIWVGCSQILFVQAYFWCFNLQYRSM